MDYNRFKKLIPRWIKWLPSWLLLAPQRQEGVAYTWMVETRGFWSLVKKMSKQAVKKELMPVTICTGIKNRTNNYLTHVLPSILKMEHQELIHISIFDCGSDDRMELEHQIRKLWKGPLSFISEEVPFARSYSFNKAVEKTETKLIFIADADLTLPQQLVKLCNQYVSPFTVWYPIFFDLKENATAQNSKESGNWYPTSLGMFGCTQAQFEDSGKLNERYKKWGAEDEDLWFRFYRAGYFPIRTRPKGFFHHWHEFTEEKKEVLGKKRIAQ